MNTINKIRLNTVIADVFGFLRMFTNSNITVWCKMHILHITLLFAAVLFSRFSAYTSAVDRPDPGETLAVFQDVQEWIINWEQPGEYNLPDNVTGVWIAIRRAGRIMGQAQDMKFAFDKEVPPISLPRAVRMAMNRAKQAARGKGDPAEQLDRQSAFPLEPNTVELQLAHKPRRIRATSMSTVISQVRPGIDGILLQRKGKVTAASFPGQMLADGLNPSQALLSLLSATGISLAQLSKELASGVIRVWAFEVDHLTQTSRGEPASFMYRGSHIVPASDINTASLYGFSDLLFNHLLTHRLPSNPDKLYRTFLGMYDIELNLYEPFVCSNRDQAICIYALIRYAGFVNFSSANRDKAFNLAMEILNSLYQLNNNNNPDENNKTFESIKEPGTAAMIIISIDYIRDNKQTLIIDRGINYDIWLDDLYTRCFKVVSDSFSIEAGFSKEISVSDRAKCAMALGTVSAIDAAWQSTSDKLQPDLLPWLGWAEIRLADKNYGGTLRSASGLKYLREQIWDTQYSDDNNIIYNGSGRNRILEPDLVGCLWYEGRASMPSWKTARPLAFLASIIADRRLTSDTNGEQITQILNATAGFRFLKQLTVREADQYRISDMLRAQGGVRSSLISTHTQPAATAMTLIAVIEMLENLDTLYRDK